ncbi:MAG: hypothetical protein IKR30_02285 [Bacteroidales bacterium]|nr:hypothetical protein [Bacteroidales bacterium]
MTKKYLNESHRQYSEACQKEVADMMKHPLSAEEKEAQMLRNKYGSPLYREPREEMEQHAHDMKEALKRELAQFSKDLHPYPELTIRKVFEVYYIAMGYDKKRLEMELDQMSTLYDIDSEADLLAWLPWCSHTLDLEYGLIWLRPRQFRLTDGKEGWLYVLDGYSDAPTMFATFATRLQQAGVQFVLEKDIKVLLKRLGYWLRSRRSGYKEDH